MSGSGQAKAKKKSAKKTAAGSVPAPRGARLEEFIIGNVRCFADTQRVPIRPITILVGENSTGKTTFLGGYWVIHNLTMTPSSAGMSTFEYMGKKAPSFNAIPFRMGVFHDILNHNVINSHNPSFQLGAKIPYQARFAHRNWVDKTPIQNTRKRKSGEVDIIYSFEENESGAAVRDVSVDLPNSRYNECIEVALGKPRYDGVCQLAIEDPLTKKYVNVGGFSSALYAHEIALALSTNPDAKIPKMRNIHKILDEHFYSGAGERDKWRQLTFYNDAVARAFAPDRSRPERTYDPADRTPEEYNPHGDHIPMLLARLSRANKQEWRVLRKRLVAFGKESGMFSDFDVRALGPLLSDPFQIQVETADGVSNLLDVGYGVGQACQLLAQIMRDSQRKTPATFLLQEPEAHLHPRAQAALVSLFAKSAKK